MFTLKLLVRTLMCYSQCTSEVMLAKGAWEHGNV